MPRIYRFSGLRVTVYPHRQGPFAVQGVRYPNLRALAQRPDTVSVRRRYPCFDEFDAAPEDRCYHWRVPCASVAEAAAVQAQISRDAYRLQALEPPQYEFGHYRYQGVRPPLVYYEDENERLIVAEARS